LRYITLRARKRGDQSIQKGKDAQIELRQHGYQG
jgi:hypothetical protein